MAQCEVAEMITMRVSASKRMAGSTSLTVSNVQFRRSRPSASHCRCRIIDHGVEVRGQIHCCANCAQAGVSAVADRVA